MSKVHISPSILSADFMNLASEVSEVCEAGADWIHVDVMDGHFVPNLTIGPAHVKALKKVTNLPLDVHIMVSNPDIQAKWYLDAGADCLTFHIEAAKNPADIVEQIHASGAKAGISLNPETEPSAIFDILPHIDIVLVMSVHPGFGGQSFIESSIDKIIAIKQKCREFDIDPIIEVDGGINAKTAPACVKAGASYLVAGNAVFGKSDRGQAMKEIRDACNV